MVLTPLLLFWSIITTYNFVKNRIFTSTDEIKPPNFLLDYILLILHQNQSWHFQTMLLFVLYSLKFVFDSRCSFILILECLDQDCLHWIAFSMFNRVPLSSPSFIDGQGFWFSHLCVIETRLAIYVWVSQIITLSETFFTLQSTNVLVDWTAYSYADQTISSALAVLLYSRYTFMNTMLFNLARDCPFWMFPV